MPTRQEERERKKKIQLYVGIGIGVLVLGGAIFWAMSDSEPQYDLGNKSGLQNYVPAEE
jgi:hypothetical protein